MYDKTGLEYEIDPQKRVPVIFDVDVAIAGAGIAGIFAAIASGRSDARTVLIDRFGSLGGNIGPAMLTGGGLYSEADYTLPGGYDPSGMRARPSMMTLGQATGVAAALAVKSGVTPKTLDIKALQKTLVSQGLYLGDEARLKELGVK